MRIIFCGEDPFSVIVLESLIKDNHKILEVFCPKYQNKIYARLKMVCQNHNINFHRIDDINATENQDIIRKQQPDILVVCHFKQVLKKNIIEIPKYGCINLHPSLLPNYRGLSPQHWPIINGENETGITVHFINEGIDKGDIITQHKVAIQPDMYVFDLQVEMMSSYKFIVKDAIKKISKQAFKPVSQNFLKGSYFGELKEQQCNINLNKSYRDAYNLIRGVSYPYFGARLNNYQIWKARLATQKEHQEIVNTYGTNGIYIDDTLGPLIKFTDGSLIVNKINSLKIKRDEKYNTKITN